MSGALMMQEKTDAELIEILVTAQGEAAFSEIVSRHDKMVYRVCREILHDGYEAEDASQEVFALLTQKAKSLKNRNKLGPWLYGVARNVSLQMLRRRAVCFDNERMADLEDMAMSEEELERMGMASFDALYDAIASLSEVQQQAIIFRYIKGYSERESAQLAGCQENTLAKRASNGIVQLRTTLVKQGAIRNKKKGKAMIKNTTNRVITALGGLPHAGPSVGDIIDTAADPNRLYTLGRSSLYVSTNGGATWSIRRLPHSGCTALGVSPANPDHLLLARTAFNATLILSQSMDGGATWAELKSSATQTQHDVLRIRFSPTEPTIAYLLLVPSKAMRFDLGSQTLTEICRDYVRDMGIDPAHGDRFRLSGAKSLLATENGGQTWVAKDYPKGLDFPMSLAVDPNNSSRLVVAFQRMFLSEDAGDSWKDLGQVGKSYIDHIAFDPVNPQRIVACDRLTGLTISNNGGRTWNPTSDSVLTTYAREMTGLHVSKLTPGLVIVSTRDGLYRSTDGGQNFAAVHDGLQQNSSVVGLAVDPSNPKHVIARTSSRVYHSDDAGRTWAQSGGVASCVDWTQQSIAIDADGMNCYAGNMEGDFLRSVNRGISFEPVPRSPQFATVVADTTKPGKLFGAWPGVQISEDGGDSWSTVKGLPNWIWALAISPVDPKVVYVSGAETVFHMVADEETGNPVFVAAKTPPETIVRQLFADPVNPKRALAVNNHSGMWQTDDGGETWSRLCSGRFCHPYVRALEPDVIYVSTDSGFFAWSEGQLWLIDENMTVNAYAEVSDGLLLGTDEGIYKLTWK